MSRTDPISKSESEMASSIESKSSEVSSENQGAGLSQMFTIDHATSTTKTITIQKREIKYVDVGKAIKSVDAGEASTSHARMKYLQGDVVKYQNGKIAYTVRKPLGCGAFGEVYLVWSEVQQKFRAMKCTKFADMDLKERMERFQPMCKEALLMMELRHHPNIISLRFVKVSGPEFLVVMDLVDGSSELSETYKSGSIWTPLEKHPSLETIPQTTSLLSHLWYQLACAMDHLHNKQIMVCFCSFVICSSHFEFVHLQPD